MTGLTMFKYKADTFVSKVTMQKHLTDIFNHLDLPKAANLIDLPDFYEVELVSKKIKGRTVEGYIVKAAKF